MARHVFDHEAAVLAGRLNGEKTKRLGLGIHGQTPEQRHAASVAGGKTQGRIQGPANVASGQWEKIRTSPESVEGRLAWARSEENKKRCAEMGRLQGPRVDWSRVRTLESCKLGAKIGGPIGRHNRHHVNRKLLNPLCPLCVASRDRGETWFTAIYIPSTNGRAGKIKPLSEYENLTLEI
jgi:hypothetical protein